MSKPIRILGRRNPSSPKRRRKRSRTLRRYQRRFVLCLAASFGLHLVLILSVEGLGLVKPLKRPTPAALVATLVAPPETPPPPLAPPSSDSVLKDTLPQGPDAPPAPTPPLPDAGQGAKLTKQRAEAEAKRKLSQQVFYPPEAIAQGLQGEVRVLVALDEAGKVTQAKVVVSSGKDVLDKAAVAAVYRIGRIPDAGMMDFVLPVIFTLE
jgi:periplasmic protein TonB